MHDPIRILSLLLMIGASRVAGAQLPQVTPEQQLAVLEATRLINAPAEFVLTYREDLALTPPQIANLEKLAAALRDSSTVRMTERVRESQQNASQPATVSAMGWTGAVDEAGIREFLRQQASLQAELVIASARDRRAVAALLTAEQIAKLPGLQMNAMMKAMRNRPPTAPDSIR